MSTSEIRRLRLEAMEQEQDLRERAQTNAPEWFVGTVTGSPGTTVPAYFKVKPQSIKGTPTEGGAATFADGIGTPLVYVLGPTAPTLGQRLTCWRAGGGWVAETCCGTTETCGVLMCNVCGGVRLLDGGTLTDASGTYPLARRSGTTNWFTTPDHVTANVPSRFFQFDGPPADCVSRPGTITCDERTGTPIGYTVSCSGTQVTLTVNYATTNCIDCTSISYWCGTGMCFTNGAPQIFQVDPDSCSDTHNLTATFSLPNPFVSFPCGDTMVNLPPPSATVTVSIPLAPPGSCCLNCSPCQIPKKDLVVSWVNTLSGTGSVPLRYSEGHWNSACSNQLLYALSCPGGVNQFSVTYFLTGDCPKGQQQSCTSPGRNPFSLVLQDYTCNPFHLHYRCTVPTCVVLGDDGYTDFYIDDPSPGTDPLLTCPCTGGKIHVTGCSGGLPGASVTINDGSGATIESGTTDASGNWTPTVNGGPYSIVISKARFDTQTLTNQTLCSHDITVTLNPSTGYVCLQGVGCSDPVKTTLTATHSIFGTTTATVVGGVSWVFTWDYAYPGFETCTAQPSSPSIQFGNVGHFGPDGPIVWGVCDVGFICILITGRDCPISPSPSLTSCFDDASPVLSSLACPPSFVWSGTITYTIGNPSCQRLMYGVSGSQTFTLTLSE